MQREIDESTQKETTDFWQRSKVNSMGKGEKIKYFQQMVQNSWTATCKQTNKQTNKQKLLEDNKKENLPSLKSLCPVWFQLRLKFTKRHNYKDITKDQFMPAAGKSEE